MKKFKKETIASKAGIGSDKHHGSIIPPLYLSSNFEYRELGIEQEYEYTRETNPTRDHLINALAIFGLLCMVRTELGQKPNVSLKNFTNSLTLGSEISMGLTNGIQKP